MAVELSVGVPNVLLSELAIVGGTDFFSATLKSLVVILVTEIGDKTFFIAAVWIDPYVQNFFFDYSKFWSSMLFELLSLVILSLGAGDEAW